MTTQSIDVKWATNMTFKANVYGHELIPDLEETAGGTNLGPKPKPLIFHRIIIAGFLKHFGSQLK
jgi:hypothetical protein